MKLDDEEFEFGEEVTEQFGKPSKLPGMTLSVHLDNAEAHVVLDEAHRRGITTLELLRLALRQYIDVAQSGKKEGQRSA